MPGSTPGTPADWGHTQPSRTWTYAQRARVGADNSMALLDDIKSDWLGIAAGNTSADAAIQRFIAAAQTEIENICNQPLWQRTVVRTFRGNGSSMIWLPYLVPIAYLSMRSR